MGKKSKAKKTTKKGRANIKKLRELDHADSEFSLKLDNLPKMSWLRRRLLIEDQIQIQEQFKELDFVQSCYKFYCDRIAALNTRLFFVLLHSQKYSEALNQCRKILQFSSPFVNKPLLAPYIDLFLLRVDKSKHDLHADVIKKLIEIVNQAGTENDVEERFIGSQNAYILNCLFELSRLQMYHAVKYLSETMLRKDDQIERDFPINELSNFYLFSLIAELRYDILDNGASKHELLELAQGNCKLYLLESARLPFVEELFYAYLASAILCYYATFYEKCNSFEVEEHCIDAMTKYLDFKSSQLSNCCSTCHEADKDKLLLCQGCRVVSFCCRNCQRLNYLHHEDTGIRGLGHKYLCPVFKAYHRRNKNTDASKKDHLDRKFRRACKSFLVGTLQSVDEERVNCLILFKTQEPKLKTGDNKSLTRIERIFS
ncbi:predicted protein [Chaetoceros tenuissimus]|uniref:MYND-type domain-containing protein n=1 Tax=Chaetoceros tenuissimus TaxID=426638 RepID=A0AAD3DBS2_9STRA|nr:predicted protein [Chaetoceros tenuissimus]